MNVILTRAISLFIIIGDASTLSEDENWLKFIEYCNDNDGITKKLHKRIKWN